MSFSTPPYDGGDIWLHNLEASQANGLIDPSLDDTCSPKDGYRFAGNSLHKPFPQELLTPYAEASQPPTFHDAFLAAENFGASNFYSRSESHGRSVSPLSLRNSPNCSDGTLLDERMYDSTGLPSTPGDLPKLSPSIEDVASYVDNGRAPLTSLSGIPEMASTSGTPTPHWMMFPAYNSYNDLDHSLSSSLELERLGSPSINGPCAGQTTENMGLGIDETTGPIYHTPHEVVSPSAYPDFADGHLPAGEEQSSIIISPQASRAKQAKGLNMTKGVNKKGKAQQMVVKERAKTPAKVHSRSSTKTIPSTTASVVRCGPCNKAFRNAAMLEKHRRAEHVRPFICVFHFAGCQATFAAKNEWKRHVTSQHLCLTYYLCTHDNCAQGKLESAMPSSAPLAKNGHAFNRKDLYTQHVRRTHVPPQHRKTTPREWEDRIKEMQDAALRNRCGLPRHMTCPVPDCDREFVGDNAWDERMEHVVKHMTCNDSDEYDEPIKFGQANDTTLTEWAEEVDVIRRTPSGGWELCYPLNERSGRRGGARRNAGRAKASRN